MLNQIEKRYAFLKLSLSLVPRQETFIDGKKATKYILSINYIDNSGQEWEGPFYFWIDGGPDFPGLTFTDFKVDQHIDQCIKMMETSGWTFDEERCEFNPAPADVK